MKMIKILFILFTIVIFGYILYFVIGMSSTYPAIKEYKFSIAKSEFNQRLAERIKKSQGWSLERSDSIKGNESQYCHWLSLHYRLNEQHLEYRIKYCEDSPELDDRKKCFTLYIVGAFDYYRKSGGYKRSDQDVDSLIQILDQHLLNEIAPSCLD